VALAIHFLLPDTVRVTPSWVVPAIGLLFLVPLLAVNPARLNRETTLSKWISVGLALGLATVTQVSIVLIIRELIAGRATGPAVLLTALAVWMTNVIAFALIYWEIDRGGPVARRIEGYRDDAQQDFRFPQEEPGAQPHWMPVFFDYVYFSLSNMMAFSPTDVMPLTTRAKALMGYQALTGFVLLALVISRAVNILTTT
jgi:uncharacterized membrane protein